MTEHDKILIENAKRMRWEDIEESAAETSDGRAALHSLRIRKYHRDEYECGML